MVSTVGFSSARRSGTPLSYCSRTPSAHCSRTPLACYSGTPIAYCWGTPSFPFVCPSARLLRGGSFMLSGGAIGTSSSSDHSDITVL